MVRKMRPSNSFSRQNPKVVQRKGPEDSLNPPAPERASIFSAATLHPIWAYQKSWGPRLC
jgi:hypothetical protein